MKKLIIILLLASTAKPAGAQGWVKNYFTGQSDSYSARTVIELPDGGGLLMGGGHQAGPFSFRSPVLLQLFPDGEINDFHTPFSFPFRNDEINQIIDLQDGGFAIIGDSQNWVDNQPSNHYVAKLNLEFDIIWKVEFDGMLFDKGNSILELDDGSLIGIGAYGKGQVSTTSGGVTTTLALFDGQVVKLDNEGNIIWEYKLTGFDMSIFNKGLVLPNGDIIVSGFADLDVEDMIPKNPMVLRLNGNGEEIWRKEFSPEEHGQDFIPFLLPNGKTILAGSKKVAFFPAPDDEDLMLHEIDDDGEIISSQQFSLGDQSSIGPMVLADNGDLIIGGSEFIDDTNLTDPYYMRLDMEGNILQKEIYPSENYREFVRDIHITDDGGVLLCGRAAEDFQVGNESHAFLIKSNTGMVPVRENIGQRITEVVVFPVPAHQAAHFILPEYKGHDLLEITLTDVSGQLVGKSTFNDGGYIFEKGGLGAGTYFYQIKSMGHILATGDFVFQ